MLLWQLKMPLWVCLIIVITHFRGGLWKLMFVDYTRYQDLNSLLFSDQNIYVPTKFQSNFVCVISPIL